MRRMMTEGRTGMMKRLMSVLFAVILLTWFCVGGAAETASAPGETEKPVITVLQANGIPSWEWQKTAAFPDWKGYTDDTLAMNSMISFYGYHGQGQIFLNASEETESFSLYVNGVKAELYGMGGVLAADISEVAKDGINTLQISNILPLGLKNAVTVYIPYPEVLPGEGESGGIQPLALKLVEDLIASDVAFGFPSAQLAVVRNGRMVYENAWGKVNAYAPDGTPLDIAPAVTTDTMYDLASVTKMFATNYAVQKLVTDGVLDIDTPVVEILGDAFAADTLDIVYADSDPQTGLGQQIAWKRSITPRDLMRHQAGFPPDPQYFKQNYDLSKLAPAAAGSNPVYALGREETLKAIFKTPLLYEPGSQTKYSDVDYMLLGFIVEKVTGKRLDDYVRETFYDPMGLTRTTYLPLGNGFAPEDCAATELNGNTRDHHVSYPGVREETLQGEVHDEKAWYCMEGVSGHAGLFSSASDLARLASVMITGGYGAYRFFSRTVLDAFTVPKALDYGQWGLGWWRQGDDQRVWYFGTQASSGTVGHQGWTGTLAMVDAARDLVIVYLTNTINSPVTDGSRPDRFNGNDYIASTLGFVPQILSVGLDEETDVSAQLTDLLADMAAESLKLIPDGAGADHPYVQNALSKIAVLKAWAIETGETEYILFAEELTNSIAKITG